jgi:RNA polymerase sigma factor (TIGR02999 family)
MPLVYGELRRIADAYLRRERAGHTLQPTALVNEAWLRLVRQENASFAHRRQFYGLAAQVMRRILVDHARAARADKRGGSALRTELPAGLFVDAPPLDALLSLDRALTDLAHVSPRQAQVIEMRYFAGLNVQEVAELLSVSIGTVSRDQRVAEAWLGQAMAAGA